MTKDINYPGYAGFFRIYTITPPKKNQNGITSQELNINKTKYDNIWFGILRIFTKIRTNELNQPQVTTRCHERVTTGFSGNYF